MTCSKNWKIFVLTVVSGSIATLLTFNDFSRTPSAIKNLFTILQENRNFTTNKTVIINNFTKIRTNSTLFTAKKQTLVKNNPFVIKNSSKTQEMVTLSASNKTFVTPTSDRTQEDYYYRCVIGTNCKGFY